MGEGRGAIVFSRTLSSLARRGHDVHVSLPAGEDNRAVEEPYLGFVLHREPADRRLDPRVRLPLPLRLWERYRVWTGYQRWALAAALRVAEAHPPDLVIGYGSFEAPVARKVAEIRRVPNVSRLFGCWTNPDDWLRYHANFPEVRAFRTPADLLIVTNDGSEGDRMARKERFPPERFVFLRNGVEFPRFHPGPGSGEIRGRLGIAPEQPLLLVVGRISYEKRLDRAVRALPELLEKVPEAVLVVVGDGDEKERIIELSGSLGVAEHVRLPGAVDHSELPDWFRSADLVLSLLDRTNAANPTFEAMACGRPVVALDVGSTRQVVRDGENGVVLGYDDLPRLGNLLADLLSDRARLSRLGAAAAESIRELLVTPEERIRYEIELLEATAARRPIERRLPA